VDPILDHGFGDLDNVGPHERLAAREEDDIRPDPAQVLGNPASLLCCALLLVGVGIDDVALLATQIASGRDVELNVQGVLLEEH
jgi:hypothetical protein